MIILGIETSCDDTCIAIIRAQGRKNLKFKILSNIVSSQARLHTKYGGVYPSLAKIKHQRNLPIVLKKIFPIPKIDFIAVTVGPGLEPCLWQGINFAKELAEKLKLPIIPVNHIEAHILANFIRENPKFEIRWTRRGLPKGLHPKQIPNPKLQNSKLFPAICLVVSGGHTQLILMRDIGKYRMLGETRDDAAGECFDKTARILGLGYPGGPAIAEYARQWKSEIRNPLDAKRTPRRVAFEIKLPRPMIYQKNYDFSFSGLKTAVLYKVKRLGLLKSCKRKAICFEIQQAIIDVLIHKTLKAVQNYKAKSVILGGGVAANQELREQLNQQLKIKDYKLKFLVPPKNLCADNAVMIAVSAYFHQIEKKKHWQNIKADANLKMPQNL